MGGVREVVGGGWDGRGRGGFWGLRFGLVLVLDAFPCLRWVLGKGMLAYICLLLFALEAFGVSVCVFLCQFLFRFVPLVC